MRSIKCLLGKAKRFFHVFKLGQNFRFNESFNCFDQHTA